MAVDRVDTCSIYSGVVRIWREGVQNYTKLFCRRLHNKNSAVAEMGDRLATINMGQKVLGVLSCPFLRGEGAGCPSNSM